MSGRVQPRKDTCSTRVAPLFALPAPTDLTLSVQTWSHLEEARPQMPQHRSCRVGEKATSQAREQRANRSRPPPKLARMWMVVLVSAMMGYVGYVYIGRFCKSIIKQDRQSTSGRATGIVLLVIFCVLYLWTIWAYMKVVLTPPGFARDYILHTPQPPSLDAGHLDSISEDTPNSPISPIPRPSLGRPVLHPAHRYCHRESIVKPYRAQHCRDCGTCVLKYDHHCLWIGQCVGARNHKFYLIFRMSTAVLMLYSLGTLIGFNVSAWTSESSDARVDPQIIVASALALLLSAFSVLFTYFQINLILKCQTVFDRAQIRSLKERETELLTKEYGQFTFRSKRQMRQQWREELGDMDTEGNMWWTGSKKQGWIDVMGRNPLGWILPIGESRDDGLSYTLNPRFDEQGRLRRRVDWPAELQ